MFRFETNSQGEVTILTVQGHLDAVSAGALKAEVVTIADAKRLKVVVDLSGLTLLDSSGVGVLISLFKRTRAQGGHVYFAGLQGQPKEIFRLLRLDRSLDISSSATEAVQKLKGS